MPPPEKSERPLLDLDGETLFHDGGTVERKPYRERVGAFLYVAEREFPPRTFEKRPPPAVGENAGNGPFAPPETAILHPAKSTAKSRHFWISSPRR